MPKKHRHQALGTGVLSPTKPVPDVPLEVQVDHMEELRKAQNDIAASFLRRDQLMQALALSNTLSREDMAVATGLAKSRVDQLIREITERDVARKGAAAANRAARHMP
jgi:hypothetical protein